MERETLNVPSALGAVDFNFTGKAELLGSKDTISNFSGSTATASSTMETTFPPGSTTISIFVFCPTAVLILVGVKERLVLGDAFERRFV